MTRPVICTYDGEAFVPVGRYADVCNKDFVVGERYPLIVHEERSANSHAHYFAALHDAWLNLPEELADELPTAEHLRAWALCKAGYADKTVINCASAVDAARVALMARTGSKIKIADIAGKVVKVWTPHSQSQKAMGKQKFQDSKTKVLDIVSAMARTTRPELEENAGKAA